MESECRGQALAKIASPVWKPRSIAHTPTGISRLLPRRPPSTTAAATATLSERLADLEAALPGLQAAAAAGTASWRRQLAEVSAPVQRLEGELDGVRGELESLRAGQGRAAAAAREAAAAAAREAAACASSAAAAACGAVAAAEAQELRARVDRAEEHMEARSDALSARLETFMQAAAQQQRQAATAPVAAETPGPAATGQEGLHAGAHMAAFAAMLGGGVFGECASMAPTESAAPLAGAPLPPCQSSVGGSIKRQRTVSGAGDPGALLLGLGAAASERGDAAGGGGLEVRVAELEWRVRELGDVALLNPISTGAIEARVAVLEERIAEQLQAAEERAPPSAMAPSAATSQRAAGAVDAGGAPPQRPSLGRQRKLTESLRAVDAFGEQLNALLTRFAPDAPCEPEHSPGGTSRGSSLAPAPASAAPPGGGPAPVPGPGTAAAAPAASAASWLLGVEVAGGAVQEQSASGDAASHRVVMHVDRIDSELGALWRAHEAAAAAAVERAAGADASLMELRGRVAALADSVDAAASAAAEASANAHKAGMHQGLDASKAEAWLKSLEEQVAALSEAAERASATAAEAAAAWPLAESSGGGGVEGEAGSKLFEQPQHMPPPLEPPAAAVVAEAASVAKAAAAEAGSATEAAAAAAKVAAEAATAVAGLRGELDELARVLYEQRVETQNGFEDAERQLQGLTGLKDDLEIWQAGQRAAAERTERAAAETSELVEALAVQVAGAPVAAVEAAKAAVMEAAVHAAKEAAARAAKDEMARVAQQQAQDATGVQLAADWAVEAVVRLEERVDALAERASEANAAGTDVATAAAAMQQADRAASEVAATETMVRLQERVEALAVRADTAAEAAMRCNAKWQQHDAAERGEAPNLAASAAVAELTLRLQALSVEATARLDALADHAAVQAQAIAALAPAAESAQAAASEAAGAASRAQVGANQAAAGVAAAKAELAVLALCVNGLEAAGAAAAGQLQQLLPLLEATDVVNVLSPSFASAARGTGGGARPPRFSLDSLDSPSFSVRCGNGAATISWISGSGAAASDRGVAGGGGGLLNSGADRRGGGAARAAATPACAYENSLFGEPPEESRLGGPSSSAGSTAAVLLPHGCSAGAAPDTIGAPLSFYSNAAFEDDTASTDELQRGSRTEEVREKAEVAGPAEGDSAAAAARESAVVEASSAEWPAVQEASVSAAADPTPAATGDSVRRQLFSTEEESVAAAAQQNSYNATESAWPQHEAPQDKPTPLPTSPEESPLLHGLAGLSRLKTKTPTDSSLAQAPHSGGHPSAGAWAVPGNSAACEQAGSNPSGSDGMGGNSDSSAAGGDATHPSTPSNSVAAFGARFGGGMSSGGSGGGMPHLAPLRPSIGGKHRPPLHFPVLPEAAPATPVLKPAPHVEKGPSGFEVAKEELKRAAQASPGRVRRQAMAMDNAVAVLAAGSSSDSGGGSPRHQSGSSAAPASSQAGRQQLHVGSSGGGAGMGERQPHMQQLAAGERVGSPLLSRLVGDRVKCLLGSEDSGASSSGAAASEATDDDSDFLLQLPGLECGGGGGGSNANVGAKFGSGGIKPVGAAEEAALKQVASEEVLRLRGGAYVEDGSEAGWEFQDTPSLAAPSSRGGCDGMARGRSMKSSNGAGGTIMLPGDPPPPPALAAAPASGALLGGVLPCGATPRPKRRLLGFTSSKGSSAAAAASTIAAVLPGPAVCVAVAPVEAAQAGTASLTNRVSTATTEYSHGAVAPAAGATTAGGHNYRVVVCTSARRGAGTDGLASLRLIRDRGSGSSAAASENICKAGGGGSPDIELRLNSERGIFTDGSRIEFLLEALGGGGGGIAGMELWHDGEGYENAWMLDKVVVQELGTGGCVLVLRFVIELCCVLATGDPGDH
jgi:hypothetical protein